MASFDRIDRISQEVHKAIDAIIRDELNDPRIGGTWSIVRCEVTRDLRYCKVRVSILEEEKRKDMMAALKKAAGFVRRELGRAVDLRYVPEIQFELDTNIEYAAHINQLLKETQRMTKRVTIEALAEWLQARDDIVLLGHVYPGRRRHRLLPGAVARPAAMGKRAVVCLPGGVPRMYAGLPGADGVFATGDALPFEVRTAVAVDVSEYERLGDAGKALFDAAPQRAVIDHHSTNHGFGQLMLLDGEAAAAGELAVDLIEAMGVKLTREMAECLFVAISTDCGHFNYSNTREQTFRRGGEVRRGGHRHRRHHRAAVPHPHPGAHAAAGTGAGGASRVRGRQDGLGVPHRGHA